MTPPVHVALPGDRPPWSPTGVHVRRGARVTLLGSGRIRWSGGGAGGPKHHLWGRVPGGEAFGCPGETVTVVADRTGELELCVYLGDWADRGGTLVAGSGNYRAGRGALAVTVLHWPAGTDPVQGLAALPPGAADPRLVAAERARLLDPVIPPPGWAYHPTLGPGEIFHHAVVEGRPAVRVECDDAAGILTTRRRVPLAPGTRLEWSWRVDALPGDGAEDRPGHHDHVGIGLGFGTGRGLDWFWSTALPPVDGAFACPAPGWAGREVHVPVRSGPVGLGRWRRESRDVWADHRRFVGEPPRHIEEIRLLAVSHHGGRRGAAVFADVILHSGGERVRVL